MKIHQTLSFLAFFGIMSCTASTHDKNHHDHDRHNHDKHDGHDRSGTHKHKKHHAHKKMELAGKTVSHTWTKGPWAGASFVTFFCNDDTLVWNNISDPDNVRSEQETYFRSDVTRDVVQISWKESPDTTNYGLIWTLNVHSGKITGVIVNASPVSNVNVSGTYSVTDGLNVDKSRGLTGCKS